MGSDDNDDDEAFVQCSILEAAQQHVLTRSSWAKVSSCRASDIVKASRLLYVDVGLEMQVVPSCIQYRDEQF